MDYLGLEPDRPLRRAASADYPMARFEEGGAEQLGTVLGATDILVLNGVAHHLPEALFRETVKTARGARALILCDHLRLSGTTHALARWLQERDQGKFVRPYEELASFPGWDRHSTVFFPIGLLGIPLWTYFCNVYVRS